MRATDGCHGIIPENICTFICIPPGLLNQLVHVANHQVKEGEHRYISWIARGLEVVAEHLQLCQGGQWGQSKQVHEKGIHHSRPTVHKDAINVAVLIYSGYHDDHKVNERSLEGCLDGIGDVSEWTAADGQGLQPAPNTQTLHWAASKT